MIEPSQVAPFNVKDLWFLSELFQSPADVVSSVKSFNLISKRKELKALHLLVVEMSKIQAAVKHIEKGNLNRNNLSYTLV